MSDAGAADEWDLVVPDDDAELGAELRRHGVQPGQRLHVPMASSGKLVAANSSARTPRSTGVSKSSGTSRSANTGRYVSGGKNAGGGRGDNEADREPGAEPEFIGSFDSGQPDLAERSEEILRAQFPDR
jgi:hypothetical protein